MNTYRIYMGLDCKGAIHPDRLRMMAERLVVEYFPEGLTLYRGEGVWKGGQEETLVAEVIAETGDKVYHFAETYKELAHQESVLVTRTACDAHFI